MAAKDPLVMMERCHNRLAEQAERLRQASASGDRSTVQDCLAFFSRTTRRHYADEEQSLFPRLGHEHASLVAELTADHRHHEALLVELEAAFERGDALEPLADRWASTLGAHAAREDDELLPLVKDMGNEERAAIAAEMQARRGRGAGRKR